ncbi:MAG: hypothetical protein ABH803_02595 [Candidatus Micrarchaeota archaeon]
MALKGEHSKTRYVSEGHKMDFHTTTFKLKGLNTEKIEALSAKVNSLGAEHTSELREELKLKSSEYAPLVDHSVNLAEKSLVLKTLIRTNRVKPEHVEQVNGFSKLKHDDLVHAVLAHLK